MSRIKDNISHAGDFVKENSEIRETLLTVFHDKPKFTKLHLHSSCPKHASKERYYDFISTGKLLKTLNTESLLVPLLNFLHAYNWRRRNFCYSRNKLEKEWRMTHKTITKYLLCFYFMGIIAPYGKWTFGTNKVTGYVPVWILTDKLFSLTPETAYHWAKKFNFRVGRFTHRTPQP